MQQQFFHFVCYIFLYRRRKKSKIFLNLITSLFLTEQDRNLHISHRFSSDNRQ